MVYSESEVREKVKKWVKNGGIIRQLPPQKTPINTFVGRQMGYFVDNIAGEMPMKHKKRGVPGAK